MLFRSRITCLRRSCSASILSSLASSLSITVGLLLPNLVHTLCCRINRLTVGDWESIKGAAVASSHQLEAVSGAGDEALRLGGTLYVRRGSEGFLLSLRGPKIDPLLDKGLAMNNALALRVLAHF